MVPGADLLRWCCRACRLDSDSAAGYKIPCNASTYSVWSVDRSLDRRAARIITPVKAARPPSSNRPTYRLHHADDDESGPLSWRQTYQHDAAPPTKKVVARNEPLSVDIRLIGGVFSEAHE